MKKLLAHSALISVMFVSTTQVAFAMPISTAAQMSAQVAGTSANAQRASAWLQREDVRAQLVAHGVTVAEAQARLAALSDTDLARVNAQIDKAPAGSSALALVGIVFVVLLILELLGVTHIFSHV